MICKFACVKPTYYNGNEINIVNSNIAYVKPHVITINNINYLMFEESRINYNNKQTRDDRKIQDYFFKIANDLYINNKVSIEDDENMLGRNIKNKNKDDDFEL